MYYKLSDYAKKFNVTYRTAWNRFKAGKIKDAFIDDTNHVCIPIKTLDVTNKKIIIYSRTLDKAEVLTNFAISNGYSISKVITELVSDINDNRPKLLKLLSHYNEWDILLIENKNVITNFGFNMIETLLESIGKSIIIVNNI